MGIYKDKSPEEIAAGEPEGETIDPSDVKVQLEDGSILTAALLLDKDGNPTEILFDTVTVLAKAEPEKGGGWYELDIHDGSWWLYPLH